MSVYFRAHLFDKSRESSRYVFIHIPRTGGHSLINQIERFCECYKEGEPHQFASMIPKGDYQKITVVRDPVDRMVSIMNRLYTTQKEVAGRSFRSKGVPRARTNVFKLEKSDVNDLIQWALIKDNHHKLISTFDVTEGFWSWGITPCQTAFIDDDTEVHKFEDKSIWHRLDLPEIKDNESRNRWQVDLLSDKTIELIHDYFDSDYKAFNYKK